jgi:hypothetical protein
MRHFLSLARKGLGEITETSKTLCLWWCGDPILPPHPYTNPPSLYREIALGATIRNVLRSLVGKGLAWEPNGHLKERDTCRLPSCLLSEGPMAGARKV